MNNDVKEQLSALMDGELSRDETRFLMRRLDADTQLAKTWSNYQIASDVLKKRFATPMRADFAASVMQVIDVERQAAASRGGWMRWAGGGAIAAAVAVFALTGTRPLNEPVSEQQPTVAAVDTTSVISGRSTLPVEKQITNGVLPIFSALNYTETVSFDRPLYPQYSPMLVDPRAPQAGSYVPAESNQR
jgi:sigma-E factor negative regulatory protein RseA